MKKISTLQLAFGEMGDPVLGSLIEDERFIVSAIVTPPENSGIYRKAERLPQEVCAESQGIEVFRTDSLARLHAIVEDLNPDLVLIATYNKNHPGKNAQIIQIRQYSSRQTAPPKRTGQYQLGYYQR